MTFLDNHVSVQEKYHFLNDNKRSYISFRNPKREGVKERLESLLKENGIKGSCYVNPKNKEECKVYIKSDENEKLIPKRDNTIDESFEIYLKPNKMMINRKAVDIRSQRDGSPYPVKKDEEIRIDMLSWKLPALTKFCLAAMNEQTQYDLEKLEK